MTLLNSDNVSYNDKVFDVIHGYGTVVSTEFNEIIVKFNSGIQLTYNDKGCYGGVKRLYWHNPVIIDPPKHLRKWNTLAACIESIHKYLSTDH